MKTAVLFLAGLWVCGADLDLGDRSSATLTAKAWAAMNQKKYAEAAEYARRCISLYEKQAQQMQQELQAPVPQDQREEVAKRWALNDVGTCLFILGQAAEKQDQSKEGLSAYRQLVQKLPFAQCWDPKGWYWKPADAAKLRIKALEFDAEK
jgi:tetratricopeptide (TPR) repeat protein